MSRLLRALAFALAAAAPALADTTAGPGPFSIIIDTDRNVRIDTVPGAAATSVSGDGGCAKTEDTGGASSVTIAGCSDGEDILIRVPTGMPGTVRASGGSDLTIGDTHAPLSLALHGSGDATVGEVGPLALTIGGSNDVRVRAADGAAQIEIDGSGDVRIGRLSGVLQSTQHGSGGLVVGRIEAGAVRLALAGSGDVAIGAGSIAELDAETHGSGDIAIAATIHDARVQASGGGDVKLGRVTGRLSKAASGGSDIYVGEGLVTAIVARAADAVSTAHRSNFSLAVDRGTHQNVGWHIVSGVLIVILLVLLWRGMQRRGGVAAVAGRLRKTGTASPPPPPGHPGVLAVRETMARLDGRLAKLEGYVTSREFDLHRKFRELDTR